MWFDTLQPFVLHDVFTTRARRGIAEPEIVPTSPVLLPTTLFRLQCALITKLATPR